MMARLHLQPQARGVGMTSQRVRDALVQRLREGIEDERGIVQAPIRNENVLNAIRTVPRHLFVDEALAPRAYLNNALSIGHGQTISQPWFVARMSEAAMQFAPRKVLEIGTGSGYQAAILAVLGVEVHTVERIGDLLRSARKRFRALGLHEKIRSKHDDGRIGWAENGPFDAILVTAGAAAPALIQPLLGQLAVGGVLVAPVGAANEQKLLQLVRRDDGVEETSLAAAAFVPLLSGTQD